MSIPDLLEKINASGKEYLPKPVFYRFHLVLIIGAMVCGLMAVGEGIYLISHLKETKPVQIVCNEDVWKALQASSSPIEEKVGKKRVSTSTTSAKKAKKKTKVVP